MKAARLNEAGIATFEGWIEILKQDGATQAPLSLLENSNTTESLDADVELELRGFANRFEAAEYLFKRFAAAGLSNVANDSGLWSWLSLYYFDSVCPVEKGGLRKPGESARYVAELGNFQRYYRHLLAGPYLIYRTYRDDPKVAMCLLCQELHKPGDIVGQLAARQELVTNRSIIGLATRLYVDSAGKKKRGAESKGNGSPRRLSDVIEQFDLTWDLYAATSDELAAVMPKEFGRFLE